MPIYEDLSIGSTLFGAILGAIFGMALPALRNRLAELVRSFKVNRRNKLLQSGRVTDWLLTYYRNNGAHVYLYDCRIGRTEVKIPFLTSPEWQVHHIIPSCGEMIVTASLGPKQDFPHKLRLIKRRSSLGQWVFGEGNTFYLDRIVSQPELNVFVRPCHFSQMATKLIELEEETFSAAKSRLKRKTPLRDRCLRDLLTASKVIERPFSVGCTAVFAIRNDDNFQLLLQTRSTSTITFGGSKAVIPNFGLEPNRNEGGQSKHGILFHNFLKEYCEELFDYEELIDIQAQRRPTPDWFTCLPEARELLQLYDEGMFRLEFLGFGIDALNGTGSIALLAIVNDSSFSSKLRESITANWEVASPTPNDEAIAFIDYKDPILETWLRDGRLQYGSAFTIALAIKRLEAYDSK